MLSLGNAQTVLSRFHLIPVVGLAFSVAKIALGNAQIIAGLATGILFGATATAFALMGAKTLVNVTGRVAGLGFKEASSGVISIFYSSINLATLGIFGMHFENFRDTQLLVF